MYFHKCQVRQILCSSYSKAQYPSNTDDMGILQILTILGSSVYWSHRDPSGVALSSCLDVCVRFPLNLTIFSVNMSLLDLTLCNRLQLVIVLMFVLSIFVDFAGLRRSTLLSAGQRITEYERGHYSIMQVGHVPNSVLAYTRDQLHALRQWGRSSPPRPSQSVSLKYNHTVQDTGEITGFEDSMRCQSSA